MGYQRLGGSLNIEVVAIRPDVFLYTFDIMLEFIVGKMMEVDPKSFHQSRNQTGIFQTQWFFEDLKDTSENQEESIVLQWPVHLVLQRDDLGEGKSFERVTWYSIGMVDPLLERFLFLKRLKVSFVPPWHMRLKVTLERVEEIEKVMAKRELWQVRRTYLTMVLQLMFLREFVVL
ncbi:hypothetical protein Dimus_036121 [Dionaea muscipula]